MRLSCLVDACSLQAAFIEMDHVALNPSRLEARQWRDVKHALGRIEAVGVILGPGPVGSENDEGEVGPPFVLSRGVEIVIELELEPAVPIRQDRPKPIRSRGQRGVEWGRRGGRLRLDGKLIDVEQGHDKIPDAGASLPA